MNLRIKMLHALDNLAYFNRKISARVSSLLFASDFDMAEFNNAFVAIGCSLVLFMPGNYLSTTARLHQLERITTEQTWAHGLMVLGIYELIMLLLGGVPALFATSTLSNVGWYIARAFGFVVSLSYWGLFVCLFTMDGPSWGTVVFGSLLSSSLFGCARVGSLIAADRECLRLRQVKIKAMLELEELKTLESTPQTSHLMAKGRA